MLKTVLVVLASLTVGCATVDYVGSTYRPTTQVDLYFSEADVPRSFQVIGQALASGDQFVTASHLHAKMMDRARASGADAVIILAVTRKRLSDERRYVETTTETRDDKGQTTLQRTASESNPSAEGNEIKALFIRYR